MANVFDEPALVLHVRAFRETSAIVQFFTPGHGRIAGVVKGLRSARAKDTRRGQLQPFHQGRLSFFGRGQMVTVSRFDVETAPALHGVRLTSGLYVCELVARMTIEHHADPALFAIACATINRLSANRLSANRLSAPLASGSSGPAAAADGDHAPHAPHAPEVVDIVLRQFERRLLEVLGYGLDFSSDAATGSALVADASYRLDAHQGFLMHRGAEADDVFSGDVLLAIGNEDFSVTGTRAAARRLYRQALDAHLGGRALISRQLLPRPGKTEPGQGHEPTPMQQSGTGRDNVDVS